MDEDLKGIIITKEAIEAKTKKLAKELDIFYDGKFPLAVGVLKGAVLFMADLIRQMHVHLEIDFMDVSSYGRSAVSSGEVKIIKDLDTSVEGRDLLIVEDIIDSGMTLKYLVDLFRYRRANSIRIVTLLNKPVGRKVDIVPDWIGFNVPNEFVVGYGLDYAERYRNLPYIGILKSEIYK